MGARKLTPIDQLGDAIWKVKDYLYGRGGGFMTSLVDAAFHADTQNFEAMRAGFPELMEVVGRYKNEPGFAEAAGLTQAPEVHEVHREPKVKPLDARLREYYKPPFRYDHTGTCIWDSETRKVIDIRGWGWIQYIEGMAPEDLQDTFGKTVVALLNVHFGTPEGSDVEDD